VSGITEQGEGEEQGEAAEEGHLSSPGWPMHDGRVASQG
jgi:hypothetical protein